MRNANPVLLVILLILLIPGCKSNDDRLVDLAREHAARQAETQRQMTDLQKQVAAASRQLVESDAKAREEVTALQHDLRADQAAIGRERDQMEAERREIAAQRHRDPIVAAVILDIGIILACALPLALGVYVLRSACRAGESDSAVAELLVQELVASEPRLLLPGHSSLSAIEHQAVVDPHPGGSRDANDRPTD
jgi:hypothetical protein